MIRKLTSFSGALVICASLLVASAAGFSKTKTYTDGQFTDVPASEWYAGEVKSTYELGLMNGIGEGLFDPNGNVTVAEAVTMAARASATYLGETIPSAGGEWYQMYVNYALTKGFVKAGQFDNFDRPAKRHEVAQLFENAMPEGFFVAKNDVKDIPDVSEKQSYRSAILNLYKAGVVMGSDSYGNFKPEDNIIRAEAAAIINRVALPENRLSKKLDIISDDDVYAMSLTSSLNASKEGITSGWLYDSRGATPRSTLTEQYSGIVDISEESGAAYIREFNKTSTGKLKVYAKLSINGADDIYDGVYMEFQNDEGDSVLRLQIIDNDWKILGADGSYTQIYDIKHNELTYSFEIDLDLDNNRATVYCNRTLCGIYPLSTSGEKTNILNFRYATTEKEMPFMSPGYLYIFGNYPLKENFTCVGNGNLPIGWSGENATTSSNAMSIKKDGFASASFVPVSDTVVAEVMFLLPKAESISYILKSGAKSIATFTTDKNNFYLNGEKVYENYYANLWYRLRIEANTDTQMMLVKINGRKVAELPFAESTTSIDNLIIANLSETPVTVDDFAVFRTFERDDYVPAPVVPKGEDKYIVGMNVCSLWQNEGHFGWHCITPYDDPHPVLGYYDEGLPETADWELKYIIEHGIDFQAFCIYANSTNGVQRYSANHLYNGFMNAKYSDLSKFCVIWETANASSPSSMEVWKQHYVPYFIENFFKDPRHIVIDNKPVLCVFGPGKIRERLYGTNADVKALFDYLEEEVKKIGFDGMIYLSCGSSSAQLAEMGFDGCYAYNWGNTGYSLDVNKNSIMASAKQGSVYTVPTISVGFNSIPWHGIRYPLMTKEDYAAAQEWVKTDYLKTQPKEKWQEKLVMLSTWNEYGEGTYIMPTTDEKGFQYLDVLREAYTDEKEDQSINTIPTEEQLYRINRLYPQYRRLLRKEGYYTEEVKEEALETVHTIDYGTVANLQPGNITDIVTDKDGFHGRSTGDALITLNVYDAEINLEKVIGFKIMLQAEKGTPAHMYFTTETDTAWNEPKGKGFVTTSDEMTEYFVRCDELKTWTGRLTNFRIDPVPNSGADFVLKSVEFVQVEGDTPTKKMTINGTTFDTNFKSQISSNGEILVAFDPAVGMDFKLHCFHEWDKATGVLKLNFNKKTITFTVGSETYSIDGVEKKLGYKISSIDGLPLVPIELICQELGYSILTDEEGIITIETDRIEYFNAISEKEFGKWEFDTPGYTENWKSSFMSLVTANGYMSCKSLFQSNDPVLNLNDPSFMMPAKKYKTLELKVRYQHDNNNGDPEKMQDVVMYFLTDKDKTWSESKTVRATLKRHDTNGEWEVYSIDLTAQPLWQNNIVALRFDPFNATGYMDIDYMRFIADENYVNAESGAAQFSIENGDAKDTSNVAFWGTKIVADPENPDNNCYFAKGNQGDEGKLEWIYAGQSVTFTPGMTYKVECDIKLAEHGGKPITDPDFKAIILSNIRYSHPAEASVDHIVARKELSVADGWVHFTYEFEIPEASKSRIADQVTLYADPVGGLGVGYYFDNVKVTEVKPEK